MPSSYTGHTQPTGCRYGLIEGPREQSEIGELEAAVRARGLRLVALGGDFLLPSDHALFWLTCRDDDWERNFTHLAQGASAIVICPETTQGIRREIVLLNAFLIATKPMMALAAVVFCAFWLWVAWLCLRAVFRWCGEARDGKGEQ